MGDDDVAPDQGSIDDSGSSDVVQDDSADDDLGDDDLSDDDLSDDDLSDDDLGDDTPAPVDDDSTDDVGILDAGLGNSPADDDPIPAAEVDAPDSGNLTCSDADHFTPVSAGPSNVSSSGPNQLSLFALPDGRVLFSSGGSRGAVYSPLDDSWKPLPDPPDPVALSGSRMVLVGQRIVYWRASADESAGAILDLTTETWTEMNATGAPLPNDTVRIAVVAGQVLVFGGDTTGVDYGIARRFDLEANQWSALGDPGLVKRSGFVEAITAEGLVVWGGFERVSGNLTTGEFPDQPVQGDGARLDSTTWSWEPVSSTGAPSARAAAMSTWTGSELVVFHGFSRVEWGGYPVDPVSDGYRYDPVTDVWSPISTEGAPAIVRGRVITNGDQLFVWGDSGDDPALPLASLYDTSTDTWRASTLPYAGPEVYSSSRPGSLVAMARSSDGSLEISLLDVTENAWSTLSSSAVVNSSAYRVWLGDALLVWGGYVDTTPSGQCSNVPVGTGCDPVATYEPILDGTLFHLGCPSQ